MTNGSSCLRARLEAGKSVSGVFVKTPDPVIAEVIALAKPDFVVCDAEHGAAGARDMEQFCRAVELRGSTPMVRAHSLDAQMLSRALDAGAMGAHVPWVDHASSAERIVEAMKYQPLGRRGLAGTRASQYGIGVDLREYMTLANNTTVVVAQIESTSAVENIDEIVQVEGVDVVFIGPTDLSNSIGDPLNLESPRLRGMIDRVAEATLKQSKTFGIFVRNREDRAYWESRGARYFITNFEALAVKGLRSFLD